MTRLLKFSKYKEDHTSTADRESVQQDGSLSNKVSFKQSGQRQSVARSSQDPSVRWSRLMPLKRRKTSRQALTQQAERHLTVEINDNHQKLKQRLEYLEQVNRIYQDALELAESFSDFQESIVKVHETDEILSETLKRASKLIEFDVQSIFLMDDEMPGFSLKVCDSEETKDQVLKEFEILVNNGTLELATKDRFPLMVSSSCNEFRVLIYALATDYKINGLFFGMIRSEDADVPEILFSLMSILLSGCVNTMETCELKRSNHALKEKLEELSRLEELLRSKNAELTSLQDEMDIRGKKLEQIQDELDRTREEIAVADKALLWFKDHSLLNSLE